MSTTNFPNGVASFGIPVLGNLPLVPMGQVLFVNSAHPRASNGNVGDKDRPLATIQRAIDMCTANAGDIIIAGPGHVETISQPAGLVFNKAGVTLLGACSGSLRPTISYTTIATADVDIDAANVTIANVLFANNFNGLTAGIDVNAADFKLYNCEWRDSANMNGSAILSDGSALRMHISGFQFYGFNAVVANAAITLTASAKALIENFIIDGNFAVAAIRMTVSAVPDVRIKDGFIRNRNAADVAILDAVTGSTGWIGPNLYIRCNDDAANITEAVTGATFVVMDPVYVVNAANEKGLLINWTASADA